MRDATLPVNRRPSRNLQGVEPTGADGRPTVCATPIRKNPYRITISRGGSGLPDKLDFRKLRFTRGHQGRRDRRYPVRRSGRQRHGSGRPIRSASGLTSGSRQVVPMPPHVRIGIISFPSGGLRPAGLPIAVLAGTPPLPLSALRLIAAGDPRRPARRGAPPHTPLGRSRGPPARGRAVRAAVMRQTSIEFMSRPHNGARVPIAVRVPTSAQAPLALWSPARRG